VLQKDPDHCDVHRRVVKEIAQGRHCQVTNPEEKVMRVHGHSVETAAPNSAGFGFYLHLRLGDAAHFLGRENAHLLPVVRKFPAAIQAHDICATLGCNTRTPLSALLCLREADVLVPTSEQCIENSHRLLQNPGSKLRWSIVKEKLQFIRDSVACLTPLVVASKYFRYLLSGT
jgi:hypothetical protein